MVLPDSEDFDRFAEELLGEQAMRPLIIVAAARIDTLLLRLLSTHMLPKKAGQKDSDELLEGDRPLSAFSARIKLAYRLGLIDETLRNALEKLRSLLNPSSHDVKFDLSRSPLSDHLARTYLING